MQILYLLPPAFFLWHSFRNRTNDVYILLVPMMVMAAGHLGGNLAWLSISGEDAPDLVATAPISARRIIWAKIEAVMGAVALIFAPLIAALAFASVRPALVAGLGILVATASAIVDSTLLPHASAAQPVSPPATFIVAHRDFCRSVFVHRLGHGLGAGRGRHLARAVPGDHCHRYSRRWVADQSAKYSGIRYARRQKRKKHRTACCCRWVARMMAAMAAPFARPSNREHTNFSRPGRPSTDHRESRATICLSSRFPIGE